MELLVRHVRVLAVHVVLAQAAGPAGHLAQRHGSGGEHGARALLEHEQVDAIPRCRQGNWQPQLDVPPRLCGLVCHVHPCGRAAELEAAKADADDGAELDTRGERGPQALGEDDVEAEHGYLEVDGGGQQYTQVVLRLARRLHRQHVHAPRAKHGGAHAQVPARAAVREERAAGGPAGVALEERQPRVPRRVVLAAPDVIQLQLTHANHVRLECVRVTHLELDGGVRRALGREVRQLKRHRRSPDTGDALLIHVRALPRPTHSYNHKRI
mmetsp:Transcript_6670/g.19516  ORF Transcript_6670/g.19516 Transcript_6670/m.19516 type:complete len:269 (-) Transcript_6670:377-1183(-)